MNVKTPFLLAFRTLKVLVLVLLSSRVRKVRRGDRLNFPALVTICALQTD